MMRYHFKIHKEKGGYWTECCELEGCLTEADTLEELYKSCSIALNLYLNEQGKSDFIFPLPDETLDSNKKLVKIAVKPEIALGVLLRNYRVSVNMTQKEATRLLGLKSIYTYRKLEGKSDTKLRMINKIHTSFPEINLNYLFD